jgi:hypothetical protein
MTATGPELRESLSGRLVVPLVGTVGGISEVMPGWTAEDDAVSAVLEMVARTLKSVRSTVEAEAGIMGADLRVAATWTSQDLPWLKAGEVLLGAEPEYVGRLVRSGHLFGVLIYNDRGLALIRP